MSDIIARAEAALEGVTEGPWTVESQVDHMSGETEYWLPEIEQWRGYRNNIQCGTDKALARFIAAARTLVPELVAELKTARAQLEQRLIETVEELDALPFLAVVRERFKPSPGKGCDYGGIWERRTSGWQCIAGAKSIYSSSKISYEGLQLPAAVLWTPEARDD